MYVSFSTPMEGFSVIQVVMPIFFSGSSESLEQAGLWLVVLEEAFHTRIRHLLLNRRILLLIPALHICLLLAFRLLSSVSSDL